MGYFAIKSGGIEEFKMVHEDKVISFLTKNCRKVEHCRFICLSNTYHRNNNKKKNDMENISKMS